MNKRIFELAKQADIIQWDTLPSGARTPDHESVTNVMKFAELIIKECALTLESITVLVSETYEDFDNGYNKALLEGSTVIKQRFGVEK